MQDLRISGEILQLIQRTGESKHRHPLARLVLFLNKAQHLTACVGLVLERSVDCIQQHHGSRTRRSVLRPIGVDARWQRRCTCRCIFPRGNERRDFLDLAIFLDHKIFGMKSGGRLALLVGHNYVD